MPGVMWPRCSSKLNASSGSNQKGHSVGGRVTLWKWSVKERLFHTHTHTLRSTHTKSCWFWKTRPSPGSLNTSQVTAKKKRIWLLCFKSLNHSKFSEGVKNRTGVKRNVPFFYIKKITTQRCLCVRAFALPRGRHNRLVSKLIYISTHLSRGKHLNLCTLFQQRLTLQASICETLISLMAVCVSYVIYKAEAPTMLTRCDDATLYPLSFWCVCPNMHNRDLYFTIKGIWNNFCLHDIDMVWTLVPFTFACVCVCVTLKAVTLQLQRFTGTFVVCQLKEKRMWSPFVKRVRCFSQHGEPNSWLSHISVIAHFNLTSNSKSFTTVSASHVLSQVA